MASNGTLSRNNGIVFGRWRLVPCEGGNKDNWELCQLRGDRWVRLGRYYQSSTLANALEYAADQDIMDWCRDQGRDARAWLASYEAVLRSHRDEVKEIVS